MSPEFYIQNSCQAIVNTVRVSGLNFSLQETPFSFYITVRKSALKPPKPHIPDFQQSACDLELIPQIEQLKSRCLFLENANRHLKSDYEDAVHEVEAKTKEVFELQRDLQNLHEQQQESIANKVKTSSDQKRALEIKHERVCAENKNLKNEIENTKKDLNSTKIALKSSRKETKDTSYKFEKKVEQLNDTIKDLEDYKVAKLSEEKELKVKLRKADKKMKSVKEREAKVELERIKTERTEHGEKTDENKNNTAPLSQLQFPATLVGSPTEQCSPATSSGSLVTSISSIATSNTNYPQTITSTNYCEQQGMKDLDTGISSTDTFEEDIEKAMTKAENIAREKARAIINKKLKSRLKDTELSEEAFGDLEQELLDDMEETIQEELLSYRNDLAEQFLSKNNAAEEFADNYEIDMWEGPQFYWGGDDCCELIFVDENS